MNAFGSKFGTDASTSTSPVFTSTIANAPRPRVFSRKALSAAFCQSKLSVVTTVPPGCGFVFNSSRMRFPLSSNMRRHCPGRPVNCLLNFSSSPERPSCRSKIGSL